MQQQQPQQQRYNGGGVGSRGGNYPRPQVPGGGNIRHPHPNQQQHQPNTQQGQGVGQAQTLRGHTGVPQQLQQAQYMVQQPFQVVFANPTAPHPQTFRYQIPAQFPPQYAQTPQVYPNLMPQYYTPQQLQAAAYAQAMAGNQVYYQVENRNYC